MKYVYYIIAIFLSISLVTACSNNRSEPSKSTPTQTQPVPDSQIMTGKEPASLKAIFQDAGVHFVGEQEIQAPDFTLQDLTGKSVHLTELQGKIVFLNFWATWCPPCRAEMPSIENLYNRYKEKDVHVLAVNLQEEAPVVRTFLEKNPFTFPIVLDSSGSTAQLYGIRGIPTTFILDRKGNVLGTLVGSREWDTPEVYRLFDTLLNS